MLMSADVMARRQVEQERYEAYRRYEELTDISERLSAPVETASSFIIGPDGLVYADTGSKRIRIAGVVEKGRDEAVEAARWRPGVAFEALRRQIELEEAFDVEALARGEMAGNTLIVLSPVPDAVRAGNTDISGYNRERLRCMVRMYRKTSASRIDTITLSLDQSHYGALRAVTAAMGYDLPSGLGSEDILARRMIVDTDDAEAAVLPKVIREAYDRRLGEVMAGEWYAGSRFKTNADALSHIMNHPDLIHEHMDSIASVMGSALSAEGRNVALESLRRRAAAAFDGRLIGKDVSSISDGLVDEMVASGNYTGDCPTSLLDQKSIMSEESAFRVRQCPICGEMNITGQVKNGFITGSCGCSKEICGDRVVNSKTDKLAQKSDSSLPRDDSLLSVADKLISRRVLPPTKRELIMERYGKFAVVRTEITIGGGDQFVVDRRTGEVLAEL